MYGRKVGFGGYASTMGAVLRGITQGCQMGGVILAIVLVCPRLLAADLVSPAELVLQDVVVTARKRPESAQVVPGSMSVRTADQLAAAGATDLRSAAVGITNMTLGPHGRAFLRSDVVGASRYYYDASNSESQSSYVLINLRLGLKTGPWRAECWVRNLFDRETVPLAIPYGQDAQGNMAYIGESGAPRTMGISLARTF